jgi:hypothetical protein
MTCAAPASAGFRVRYSNLAQAACLLHQMVLVMLGEMSANNPFIFNR